MSSRTFELKVATQSWPLDKPFRIARGIRTEAHVIVVTVNDGKHSGHGEAVPCRRYGETIDSTLAQLEGVRLKGERVSREQIQELLPAGAARNALDCALWDLEAKTSGKRVSELANVPIVLEVETSFTISLDT